LFISEFRPNILFFQTSGNIFSFRIARWIAKKYNLNIILETTDDYLGFHISLNPFYYYLYYKLNMEYRIISKYAKKIIVISEEMFDEYSKKFPGKYYIAMNSIEIKKNANKIRESKIKLLYSGNLELNRWKTLLLLSSVIQRLNIDIEFDIYSLSRPSNYIMSKFKKYDRTTFKGAISSEELNIIRLKYDILVHVESFNITTRIITRLSISTKISEYLASNRPILAIGPNNIASIRYLERIKAAEVVTIPNKTKIAHALQKLLSDDYRYSLSRNGVMAAKNNHDINKVSNDIENIMKSIVIT